MNINPERRYFKLKPHAVERFEQWIKARDEAASAKVKAAEELLEEHGLPKGAVKLDVFAKTYAIAFPEEIGKHMPGLFTRPRNGFVRLKQNRRDGKRILAQIEKHKVPSMSSYFPTLGLHRAWLVGWSWVEPRIGYCGDVLVLTNIPKFPEKGEEYKPDLELLEELSLPEWAALVEKAQEKERGA